MVVYFVSIVLNAWSSILGAAEAQLNLPKRGFACSAFRRVHAALWWAPTVLVAGLARERFEGPGETGHLQGVRLRNNEIVSDRRAVHATPPVSHAS